MIGFVLHVSCSQALVYSEDEQSAKPDACRESSCEIEPRRCAQGKTGIIIPIDPLTVEIQDTLLYLSHPGLAISVAAKSCASPRTGQDGLQRVHHRHACVTNALTPFLVS